jgi:hypothetical protein
MQGILDQFTPGLEPQLSHQAGPMSQDGAWTDLEPVRDVTAASPLDHQPQYQSLAGGERGKPIWRGRPRRTQARSLERIRIFRCLGDRGAQVAMTGEGFADGLEQFGSAGFLGDITRRTVSEGFEHIRIVPVH